MADRRTTDPLTGEVIDDPHIRPFAEVLRQLSSGATHEECSEGLWDLIQRVRDTGRAGSLTLTIAVKPLGKESATALVISDEVKLKLPEYSRDPSVFYVDRNGNPVRTDPRQDVLPLQAVPDSISNVREVPTGTDSPRSI